MISEEKLKLYDEKIEKLDRQIIKDNTWIDLSLKILLVFGSAGIMYFFLSNIPPNSNYFESYAKLTSIYSFLYLSILFFTLKVNEYNEKKFLNRFIIITIFFVFVLFIDLFTNFFVNETFVIALILLNKIATVYFVLNELFKMKLFQSKKFLKHQENLIKEDKDTRNTLKKEIKDIQELEYVEIISKEKKLNKIKDLIQELKNEIVENSKYDSYESLKKHEYLEKNKVIKKIARIENS